MSLSINNQPITTNSNAFKGSWKHTYNGSQYYETNSATKTGGVIAGMYGLSALFLALNSKAMEGKKWDAIVGSNQEFENIAQKMYNLMQKQKKAMYAFYATLSIGSILCGIIVDSIRNKKAAQTADKITQMGVKNAMLSDDNLEIANSGRPYYHSHNGVKYGALLGAGLGTAAGFAQKAAGAKTNGFGIISTAIVIGLGGLIMGAISDVLTNKNARKNA